MKHDGTGILENLWGAVRIGVALATPFMRPWRVWRGCRKAERGVTRPGDDLAPNPDWKYVHAVTINAPAAEVWPWIAQIGQGRGGFYSYQRLENLAGCAIVNADRIIPELQDTKTGDGIRLHPDVPPLRVDLMIPGRALALHACGNIATGVDYDPSTPGPRPEGIVNYLWSFVITEDGPGRCRLFSTNRVEHGRGWKIRLSNGATFVEPVSYAMDMKMLCGIKRRVEAARVSRPRTSSSKRCGP